MRELDQLAAERDEILHARHARGDIDGFQGIEGWYGGYAKNNIMLKIEIVATDAVAGSTTGVTIFAKPLVRRDLK